VSPETKRTLSFISSQPKAESNGGMLYFLQQIHRQQFAKVLIPGTNKLIK
jgi:hypothetical protein